MSVNPFTQRSRWDSWAASTMVFGTAILLTSVFWMALPDHFKINENGDYRDFYEPVARQLLQSKSFLFEDGSPAVQYPPGYPILLATTFWVAHFFAIPEPIVLSAFILLAMGTASLLVFKIATLLWGVPAASVAALSWITYPFALWLSKQPNSELPFLVFLYGSFYLLWWSIRTKTTSVIPYLGCGILLGLSMLTRSIAIGMPLVMSLGFAIIARNIKWVRRLALVGVICFGTFLVVLPWEIWVYTKSGKIVPLSSGGGSSMIDGLTFAAGTKDYREAVWVPDDVLQLMREIQASTGHSEKPRSLGDMVNLIQRKAMTEPARLAKLYAIKAARAWYATDSSRFETVILLVQGVYLVVLLLSSLAAWNQGGSARDMVILVWLMVFYTWIMTTLVLSILRYMLPAIGLLFVLLPACLRFLGRRGGAMISGLLDQAALAARGESLHG